MEYRIKNMPDCDVGNELKTFHQRFGIHDPEEPKIISGDDLLGFDKLIEF